MLPVNKSNIGRLVLTFTMEQSLHALKPRRSFGTESIDILVRSSLLRV